MKRYLLGFVLVVFISAPGVSQEIRVGLPIIRISPPITIEVVNEDPTALMSCRGVDVIRLEQEVLNLSERLDKLRVTSKRSQQLQERLLRAESALREALSPRPLGGRCTYQGRISSGRSEKITIAVEFISAEGRYLASKSRVLWLSNRDSRYHLFSATVGGGIRNSR
jgi:hypothetical protein